jgi:3-polyprenyl-4-hydroxybenzoate decarboxylase
MPVKDLREWIDRIDAIGELTRVDGANIATDIGGLTDMFQWDMGNPALLFDRIAGFPSAFVAVETGEVLTNQLHGDDVDVTKFPAPVWHSGDGGNYIGTGDVVIMRTLGLYISAGKHGRLIRDKYWQRGQACPVAVSVGHDPLLFGLPMNRMIIDPNEAAGLRARWSELFTPDGKVRREARTTALSGIG